MKHFATLILSVCLSPIFMQAQITLNGRATDAETGEPLAGAHILIDNTFRTAVSSATGYFRIPGLRPGTYLLKTTYVGYENQYDTVHVTQDLTLEIKLKPAAIMGSEVIVSAVRAASNSPVTYSTITRKEIDKINLGQDMPYLLNMTPSVVTSSDAGTGIGYSSLRIRGTDLNRINVTINGIPLNDSESHGVWWVDLPDFASSTESIQIQRGVGTSTNGAAAFGASINIRTDDPEPLPYGEASISGGSYKTGKLSLRAGTGLISKRWSIDGRFSRIYSGGYIDRANADLTSFALSGGYFGKSSIVRLMVVNGVEKTYQAWDGVPGYMLDTNRTYNGLGAFYDENGELQYYENQTDNYRQTHYHLNWLQDAGKFWDMTAAVHYTRGKGYYEEYKPDQDFADYGISNAVYKSDTITTSDLIRRRYLDNHFYGLTFGLNYDNRQWLDLTVGGAMSYYEGEHYGEIIWSEIALQFGKDYRWYESRGEKTEANFFTKASFQVLPKLSLYGDIQVRQIDYRIQGTDNDLRDIGQNHQYTFVNPKIGTYYDFREQHHFYLSFGTANREPNRSALTDANPNRPAPGAETLYNAEAGYKFSSKLVSLNANLYYMHYKDQLVLTGKINDVGDPVMENVDRSFRSGLELSASALLMKNLRWDANTTFSINRIIGFTEYIDDWDHYPEQIVRDLGNTDIAFSPNFIIGSNLAYEPVKSLIITLMTKFVGKQFIDNSSSPDRQLDPYVVNDLLLSYTTKFKALKQFTISLKVNNLTNARYETNAWVYRYYSEGSYGKYDGFFPQAGINFLVGVDLKF